MTIAFDTSALAKLLLVEAETPPLRTFFASTHRDDDPFVISALAVTEVRRLSIRASLDPDEVNALLEVFRVVSLTQPALDLAGHLPARHLGTLDALHVASALLVEVDEFVTYDRRQAAAARAEGLLVHFPGAAA